MVFQFKLYYLNLRRSGQKWSLDCYPLLLHTYYKNIWSFLHIFWTFLNFFNIFSIYSRENIIEIQLIPKKRCQAKFCLADAWSARHFFSREKQVFLVGFSLTIPRFPHKSKNRLSTSLIFEWITRNFTGRSKTSWNLMSERMIVVYEQSKTVKGVA